MRGTTAKLKLTSKTWAGAEEKYTETQPFYRFQISKGFGRRNQTIMLKGKVLGDELSKPKKPRKRNSYSVKNRSQLIWNELSAHSATGKNVNGTLVQVKSRAKNKINSEILACDFQPVLTPC